jgi:predicted NAD/FAD-dependent oxidoreductase
MTAKLTSDFLIIGAGLAGLLAARTLTEGAASVMLVDKGRSVGGRLATRRVGAGTADHGAQFFTVRDPEFRALVEDWDRRGLVFVWSMGWSDGSIAATERDGHPRYAVKGGLNALAKALSEGLDCRLDAQVTALRRDGDRYTASLADGGSVSARAVLLTPPVPQSLALLRAGEISLAEDDAAALERIQYDPCVCGLFNIAGEVFLPEPGALQRPHAEIAWIADNHRKGISPNARILTLHASPAFSRAHYDAPDSFWVDRFTAELASFMKTDAHIVEAQVKRWRYSQPAALHPERCLIAAGERLVFAGDAFGSPRIEGAALSGVAAGRALLTLPAQKA